MLIKQYFNLYKHSSFLLNFRFVFFSYKFILLVFFLDIFAINLTNIKSTFIKKNLIFFIVSSKMWGSLFSTVRHLRLFFSKFFFVCSNVYESLLDVAIYLSEKKDSFHLFGLLYKNNLVNISASWAFFNQVLAILKNNVLYIYFCWATVFTKIVRTFKCILLICKNVKSEISK